MYEPRHVGSLYGRACLAIDDGHAAHIPPDIMRELFPHYTDALHRLTDSGRSLAGAQREHDRAQPTPPGEDTERASDTGTPQAHWLTRYDPDDGEPYGEICRCRIGDDHDAAGNVMQVVPADAEQDPDRMSARTPGHTHPDDIDTADGKLGRERGRIAAAHARRLREKAYRDAVSPKPGGGICIPVAGLDSAEWILSNADEAGEPVAVVAERAGRLAVYHLERVRVPDAPVTGAAGITGGDR